LNAASAAPRFFAISAMQAFSSSVKESSGSRHSAASAARFSSSFFSKKFLSSGSFIYAAFFSSFIAAQPALESSPKEEPTSLFCKPSFCAISGSLSGPTSFNNKIIRSAGNPFFA